MKIIVCTYELHIIEKEKNGKKVAGWTSVLCTSGVTKLPQFYNSLNSDRELRDEGFCFAEDSNECC